LLTPMVRCCRMVDMQKAADMKAHWQEKEGLRRQNEAMKKEKWALEKTIREQQEKLEENRKRIFKFEEVNRQYNDMRH